MKKSRIKKAIMLIGCQGVLFISGGSCLPDNILSTVAGDIVSSLLIGGFNMFATGAGLQI